MFVKPFHAPVTSVSHTRVVTVTVRATGQTVPQPHVRHSRNSDALPAKGTEEIFDAPPTGRVDRPGRGTDVVVRIFLVHPYVARGPAPDYCGVIRSTMSGCCSSHAATASFSWP
jgi:hypothetical protein